MTDVAERSKDGCRITCLAALIFCVTGCAAGAPEGGQTPAESGRMEQEREVPAVIRNSTVRDSSYGQEIRQAVLDFPSLSGQNARLSTVASRLDALEGSRLPQLTAGVSAGQAVAGDDQGATLTAQISLRQLVFDGSATRNRIALTRVTQRQLQLETDVLLSGLSQRIAEASLDLWEQTQLLQLAETNVTTHEDFVTQTQERVLGGATTGSDLLSARSRLADVQSERAQRTAALEQARASYIALIGPLPADARLPPPLPRLGDDLARVRLESSSQLAISRMRSTAAEAELAVARSGRYPGIFLELTGRQTDLLTDDAEDEVFAGFSVDQSLFTGGQQRAREEQASSNLRLARSTFDESEREARRQLDVALANRSAAEAQATAASEAVRANTAVLEASRAQFSIGRRGIIEILDAQRDLNAAQVRQIALQALRIRTELEILSLTGDLAAVFGSTGYQAAPGPGAHVSITVSGPSQDE